jgi:hypothetical protein
MNRTGSRLLLGLTVLALAGCAGAEPQYAQGNAIDADIAATHIVGPTLTSPAKTETNPSIAMAPWRDEEVVQHMKEQHPY